MNTRSGQAHIAEYRPYAGIGSRRTPPRIAALIAQPAQSLARNGFTLRSGGARGADSAFEYWHRAAEPRSADEPIRSPEIYRPDSPPMWALELVQCYLDNGHKWASFPEYKRKLLARNMQQVLGPDGGSPALFVLYWTEEDDFSAPSAGGTRYALRCAVAHNVPILNLGRPGAETGAEVLRWCRSVVKAGDTGGARGLTPRDPSPNSPA